MHVFRLARKKYGAVLSGKGAAIKGARWNSQGTEIIYTSESRALTLAEVLVHLHISKLPNDFMLVTVEIPSSVSILELSRKDLPENWNDFPYNKTTQKLGNAFVNNEDFAVFRVPSVVVTDEHNFLINPKHKDFKKIKIISRTHFPLDKRLFD